MPATPNISSRSVFGVVNNGTEQGTVTFNVPNKNAQDFYFTLPSIGTVDLITTSLTFDQINDVYVDQFLINQDHITQFDDDKYMEKLMSQISTIIDIKSKGT
jgi:hypothetical protein